MRVAMIPPRRRVLGMPVPAHFVTGVPVQGRRGTCEILSGEGELLSDSRQQVGRLGGLAFVARDCYPCLRVRPPVEIRWPAPTHWKGRIGRPERGDDDEVPDPDPQQSVR